MGGEAIEIRPGRPGDEAAIVEHTVAAFSGSAAQRLQARLEEPGGVARWCTAWRGDRLVSCSAMLEHRLWLDGAVLPVGQIEWVVTDPGYQRKGLVRAQFAHHHRRAAELGLLLTVVDGIPYVYRRLGYGYALDWPAVHQVPAEPGDRVAPGATTSHHGLAVRPAALGDVADLVALDDVRPHHGVHVVRGGPAWRWWVSMTAAADDEQLLVADDGSGHLAGWARLEHDAAAEIVLLRPGPTRGRAAAEALLARARRSVPPGWLLEVASVPGWWEPLLRRAGHLLPYDHGVLARATDALGLLRALQPVLGRRLAVAGRHEEGVLDITLYAETLRLELAPGRVESIGHGPRIEDPFAHGDVGVAPDWLPALVLGRWGAAGLAARADDVTLGRYPDLMEVLFPRLPSDVVTDL